MDNKKLKPASEQVEQIALIKWAKLHHIPLVHIPNEGPRLAHHGANLVRMGLSKGFPDLFMPEPRGGFFGMFIELKQDRHYSESEKKKISWIQQVEWIIYLNEHGYFARVIFGWREASELITMYRQWDVTEFNPVKTFLTKNPNTGEL